MLNNTYFVLAICLLAFAGCGNDEESSDTNEMAGTEMAGTEMAGTEMTTGGLTEPSDLVEAFDAVEPAIGEGIMNYCSAQCTGNESELCADIFFGGNPISEDDAACIFIESSVEELAELESFVNCLKTASEEVQMCLSALTSCDDAQVESCLDGFETSSGSCEMNFSAEYQSRIGVACFGEEPDFDCMDGTGVPGDYVCDGDMDCSNGADEANCEE